MSRYLGILLIFAGAGLALWSFRQQIVSYYEYITREPQRTIAEPVSGVDRPNILVITMDTTRWDRLGSYGSDVETPALDALAERGVRFANAFTAAPVTLPSHSSMFTGRYPFRHGVRNNGQFRLPDDEATLAERFSEAGYDTAAFVSASVLEARYGLTQGFDHYDDDLRERLDTPEFVVPTRRAELTVDNALDWLEARDAGAPFMAWVHLYDPHATYDPPQPFRSRYQGRLYEGEIAYMDSQIGRLLDWLAESGLEENTIVFALADHGEALGEHGERTHGLLIYDSTMHIPFIAAGPGLQAGVTSERLVSAVDLYPTVLEFAGLRLEGELDGRSLLGPPRAGDIREFSDETLAVEGIYMEALLGFYEHGWAQSRALRDTRYKWIHSPVPELYDVVLDPGELVNLADVQEGRHSDGQRFLEDLAAEDLEREEAALEFDAEALERLQGLGYVFPTEVPNYEERMDPKEALEYYNMISVARNLVRDERWDEARPLLERVNAALPGDQGASRLLVTAYLRDDRTDEARDVALSLMDSVSPALRPGALLTLATVEHSAEQYDVAAQLLEEALEPGPYEMIVLGRLARTNIVRRDLATARQWLERLEAAYPDEATTWMLRARLEALTGRPEAALTSLERAYEMDPKMPEANLLLGREYLEDGQLDAARGHLERALKSDPSSVDGHVAMGSLLYLEGNFDLAKAHFRQAVRLNPDSLVAQEKLALVDMAELRWQDAVDRLERLREEGLRTPAVFNNLAFALAQLGRREEALALWRRSLSMDPDSPEAHHNLGLAALHDGDLEGAERHLGRAVELSPLNLDLQATWARLLLQEGRYGEAMSHLGDLQERFPDNAGILIFLGRARTLAGEPKMAEEALSRALSLEPNDALTHLYLAELYDEQLDEPRQAITHYRAAVDGRGIDETQRAQAQSRLAALEEQYLFAPVPEG